MTTMLSTILAYADQTGNSLFAGYDYTYLLLFAGIALASYIVQANLKHKFERYSKIPVAGNLTGRDVAEKMLRDNGIYDVQVVSVKGVLTDNYNPTNKTLNLSEAVYNQSNVAAAAVAAHECGHAVQHARAYTPLKMRSTLVPVVSFASQWMMWVLLIGIFTIQIFPAILLGGICLFALTTLFSFITLPVEIDASRRAIAWLTNAGITDSRNRRQATGALRAAAYTYVVAALASLATLFYYILIYSRRR